MNSGRGVPWMALTAKELRESLWKIWIGIGLLVIIGGCLGPLYGWLGGVMPPSSLETLPDWLKDAIYHQLTNYPIYLWSNWYGKNLMQIVAVLGVVYGAGLIAGEISRGTAAFLLSKPVRRTTVLRVKYGVNLGVLWFCTALGTLAVIAGSAIAGRPVDAAWFASGLPATLGGGALILAFSLLFSVVSRDTVKAAAFAIVLLVAVSGLGFFPGLSYLSVFVQMAGAKALATGSAQWLPTAVMLLASVLVVLGAEQILVRRDV